MKKGACLKIKNIVLPKVPGYNTITRFITQRLQQIIDDLLYQFIVKLYELEEIEFENVFIDGRNSFSKTDIDTTFMHMKDAQLKTGYNVQIDVEGEYIVGLDISSERSDQLTLIRFLEKLGESLPAKYKNIVFD